MTERIDPAWLAPTWFIDSESDQVAEFAAAARSDLPDDADHTAVAVALFYAVRDGFRYDPYVGAEGSAGYKASSVAATSANWCTPKSVLLTAAARHCGIPARLGFADVRNHLSSEKLAQKMGTDLFIWHGYTEFLLGEDQLEWRKASSAFNIEMCERFGVKALDFDGTSDALMHPFDEGGNRHMEYVNQRGSFDDLPLEEIQADFDRVYGDWQSDQPNDGPKDEAFAQ
ncbi:MAG: transglutaminase family protein [Acidimicrobiales bacterium]|jgi:transglutaminase-like putative cysteine protease